MDDSVVSVLTNSRNLIPELINPFDVGTDTPINVGIDKIRVGMVLDAPFLRDREDFTPQRGGLMATWPITENASLNFFANRKRGVWRGYFTFNPARLIDPDGITLASWEETLVAIGRSAQLAYEHFFCFRPGIDHLDVYGMHLAADFGPIQSMEGVLRRCATLRAFRGVKPKAWFTLDGRNLETVEFKSKASGTVTFYDKSRESNLALPVLRAELKTVRNIHTKLNLTTVGQVTSDAVQRLFRTRLEKLIQTLNPLRAHRADEILAQPQDRRTLISMCGYEYLAQHGYFPPKSATFKRLESSFADQYPHSVLEELM